MPIHDLAHPMVDFDLFQIFQIGRVQNAVAISVQIVEEMLTNLSAFIIPFYEIFDESENKFDTRSLENHSIQPINPR